MPDKLTRSWIENAQPGPELDRLIAERVMQWKWDEARCRVCGWPLTEDLCQPGDDCSVRPLPERRADEPAPYSRDISAAWQVVEKMTDRMWCFHWLPDAKVWQVNFIDEIGDNGIESHTLPLGIVRKALLSTLPVPVEDK